MYTPKATLTYDLAYNCGTVDNAIVQSCGPGVRTIVTQVADFAEILKKGSQYGTFYQQNSLFGFWIGINDGKLMDSTSIWAENDN